MHDCCEKCMLHELFVNMAKENKNQYCQKYDDIDR